MGDCLDDDEQWLPAATHELDGEGDLNEEDVHGEDDSHDDEEDAEEEAERRREEEKKQKRKRKFEELKAKKKMKLAEDQAAEVSGKETGDVQLTPDQMVQLLQEHFPLELMDITKDSLLQPKTIGSDLFFCPSLDPSGTTESVTKKPCPFVRALSCALPGYKKMLLKTKVDKDLHGRPILIILCASAQRATEIIKSVSAKLIKCKVAKLFAKHFKISEQIEMLSKEYFPIAIGTPNRIAKLVEVGALSVDKVAICLIDLAEDSKRFTIASLPEVRLDFYRLLYGPLFEHRAHMKLALVKPLAAK